ncbi:MAG: hypothetical protein ACFB15_00925 [Cyclobacteriaceae bacterium]
MFAYNVLFILIWLVSSTPLLTQDSYKKLTEEELKSAPFKTAESLADAMLTAQRKESPYLLKESEATSAVREEFTAEKQLQTYGAIRELFGDYQSLTFVEAYRTLTDPTYHIFRFRGGFERGNAQPEVRVVMNEAAQLAGFFIRPWQDSL